jgi:hypothetical protein
MATNVLETEEEIEIDPEILRDMRWGLRNRDQAVITDWPGDHVAIYRETVVCSGDDEDIVRHEASRLTAQPEARFIVVYKGEYLWRPIL